MELRDIGTRETSEQQSRGHYRSNSIKELQSLVIVS
jgi:hypothetical protein